MLARQTGFGKTDIQYQQRIEKADREYWREAASLSQMLLGPISHQLASQRLLVVPDGALQYVPFGALPKPHSPEDKATVGSPSQTPLIADHEIVSLPSASVLAVLRQEIKKRPLASKMVAVVADPVFESDDPRVGSKRSAVKPAANPPLSDSIAPAADLRRTIRAMGLSSEALIVSRLPATREEANSILSLVPEGSGLKIFDFNANRAFAMGSELGQYRIVHFATHGFLNGEHPELSGLVLSLVDEQGNPQDGFLRLHDIYNLKLPAELVVLSACNSGLGKEVRGEGLVGIVRGFMYAGAARVVASLWKVEDDATAALMKRFYQRMLEEKQTPAKALRMAQLDLLKQKRWQFPFYWAAFILQGEWK
jgi:CHAT domain-containing protein